MYLFIDPIGPNIVLTGIEWTMEMWTREIEKWGDFDYFPDELVDIVDNENIKEIWCVCGPAAFTRIRIVTLAINTLHLVREIPIKWCHFFDIIDTGNPILKANEREYIIDVWHGETKLIAKEEISDWTYHGYGEKNDFTGEKVYIEYKRNIHWICKIFLQKEPISKLSPIYLKDPHITWSKKSTSLSYEKMKK